MMLTGEPRIAIIHDELTRRGGAEIVLEELIRVFPQADIYALYAGYPFITIDGQRKPIHTSFLQSFPAWWRRHPSRLLALLAQAAEQFDFSQYDAVLSSSSGFAKAIITRVNVPHICYCHTPTRYLWDTTHEVLDQRNPLLRWPHRLILHYLRLVDFAAAQRADVFVANSTYTQARIQTYYRRSSEVIYPPIDTSFFTPSSAPKSRQASWEHPFLLVGRVSPTKHFEQAIRACEKLEFPLLIVGQGQHSKRWRRLAGRYTRFAGRVSATELRQWYRKAVALLQPGVEDFGMSTAEALACGTPVIAYQRGGVREIVVHGRHGLLYTEAREESLAEAIRAFLSGDFDFAPELLQQRVLRFSTPRFRQAIYNKVTNVLLN